MFDLIRIYFTGLLISLLGALPLGTLNITAMQLSLQENTKNAIRFALGVAAIEIIYVRISLKGINWVMENQKIFSILEWCTVILFLGLAISSYITSRKKGEEHKNIILKSKVNRFFLGLTMSAINPVQIPFWFIWSTYLLSNGFIQPTLTDFNSYILGIAFGTLIGFALFIYTGKWIVNKLKASHSVINLLVAIIFFVSACIQLYRVLYKPFNVQMKGKTYMQQSK